MGRYIVATTVAISLTIAGALFVRTTNAMIASKMPVSDGVIELPSSTIWRIWAADTMIQFSWLLIPLVFIACFAIAMLFRTTGQTSLK